jgi:hypothetical protein
MKRAIIAFLLMAATTYGQGTNDRPVWSDGTNFYSTADGSWSNMQSTLAPYFASATIGTLEVTNAATLSGEWMDPETNEYVTAQYVQSLALSGQQWNFTTNSTNIVWAKTTNLSVLSRDDASVALFTNTTATVTNNHYFVGGYAATGLTRFESPMDITAQMKRTGGNPSTIQGIRAEVYYVYQGETNQLGDYDSQAIHYTTDTFVEHTWVISFNEPTITGAVDIIAYLKAVDVSGTAGGISVLGGSNVNSHLKIQGSTINLIEVDPLSVHSDGSVAMSGDLNMGGNDVTNTANVKSVSGAESLNLEYGIFNLYTNFIAMYVKDFKLQYVDGATTAQRVDWGSTPMLSGNWSVDGDLSVTGAVSALNLYPQRATMWHGEATVTAGNAITRNAPNSQVYNIQAYHSPPAINDAFSHSFFLKAGTYDFTALCVTSSDRGIISWSVDGSSIGTTDLYSAGATYNVVKTISSVTITGDGYHKITGVTTSKNASSSNYYMTLTKYWFKPATDAARE